MELSIVELVTCSTAIITLFIAFLTWRIAKNSLKVAKESNNFAKFQLTGSLSLKLYELKDLIQIESENGEGYGKLWSNFLSSDKLSEEHDILLSFIQDHGRANNFLTEEESNQLVGVCEYLSCWSGPGSRREFHGFKYSPRELREHHSIADEPNSKEEKINQHINLIIHSALKRLKSHHY